NVVVNASNHGFDPYAWVGAVPLSRVVSIHVAGGERLPRYPRHVIDTHGSDPSDVVLDLLAHVLRRTGPVPVVYERDHAIPPLPQLVTQLRRVRRVVESATPTGESSRTNVHRASTPARPLPRIELPDLRPTMGPWVLSRRTEPLATPAGIEPTDLDVYRDLVRTSLQAVIDRFLPR